MGLIEQSVFGSFDMQGQDILVYDHKIQKVNNSALLDIKHVLTMKVIHKFSSCLGILVL
jgi:hypothetical protein